MAIGERDPHTGHMTTGHEWNGITELNTPVPRVVFFFLGAAFLFSLVYWVLMPAWPIGVTYTRGLLGANQNLALAENVRTAAAGRAAWEQRIESGSYDEILADAGAMRTVRETGRALFGDNCAACHGADAKGGKGYPNLAQAPWLWGGTPDEIARTIQYGINATNPDTRVSQMPAFGRDQMLPRPDILDVAAYVGTLSGAAPSGEADRARAAKGKEIFAANCAACHGEDAKGKHDMGAPDLTDRFWINGNSSQAILDTLNNGRQGHMPAWDGRLTPLDRKILTLYILDLRSEQK